jgi:CheY-like chemotaxis protein
MTTAWKTTAQPPVAGHGRILVVDDEESLLKAIGRKLKALGHDVLLAPNGKRAAELLEELTFDAVFSDIDMPEMNGIELLQAVRQRDLDVPVVLMTGNPDLKTALQAVEHGAMQYLVKPFEMAELDRVAARAVRLNQMARLKREALALVRGGLGEGDRVVLGAAYDRALDTLWMAYQPIVRVADRSLFGYEALLRSEEKALPHPGAILDAAERLDRLTELGRKIRVAACVPIPDAPPHAVFFVNLHARDLMDGTLLSSEAPLSLVADRIVLARWHHGRAVEARRASSDGLPDRDRRSRRGLRRSHQLRHAGTGVREARHVAHPGCGYRFHEAEAGALDDPALQGSGHDGGGRGRGDRRGAGSARGDRLRSRAGVPAREAG